MWVDDGFTMVWLIVDDGVMIWGIRDYIIMITTWRD